MAPGMHVFLWHWMSSLGLKNPRQKKIKIQLLSSQGFQRICHPYNTVLQISQLDLEVWCSETLPDTPLNPRESGWNKCIMEQVSRAQRMSHPYNRFPENSLLSWVADSRVPLWQCIVFCLLKLQYKTTLISNNDERCNTDASGKFVLHKNLVPVGLISKVRQIWEVVFFVMNPHSHWKENSQPKPVLRLPAFKDPLC